MPLATLCVQRRCRQQPERRRGSA